MKEMVDSIRCWFEKVAAMFKLVLIVLVVFAWVTAPYTFDVNKGKFSKNFAIAKDGGDDDDDDDDGGGSSGSSGKGSSGTSGKGSVGSSGSDSSGGGGRGLTGVGGVQGLTPVSAEDEAGLVGNWGDAQSK